ncbi:MAG: hypothetical protein M3Y22_16265 [Pseudomonadota bacterium]|nr:hypothetical protein [Pseudomonadota bacterium]
MTDADRYFVTEAPVGATVGEGRVYFEGEFTTRERAQPIAASDKAAVVAAGQERGIAR